MRTYGRVYVWCVYLSLLSLTFGEIQHQSEEENDDDGKISSPLPHPTDETVTTMTGDTHVDTTFLVYSSSSSHSSTKTLPYPYPFNVSSLPTVQSKDEQLRIHIMTMPAYGHYMTTRDIAIALALRGHHVTFIGCDRTFVDFEKDQMNRTTVSSTGDNYSSSSSIIHGSLSWRSAGSCPIYEHRENVIGQLITNSSPAIMLQMLESVAELSFQMCSVLVPWYTQLQESHSLPHAIVFDADTYCAMDLSIRYRIPRVARVGTGLRDAYTNPTYTPSYSSGITMHMLDSWQGRLLNTFLIRLNRYVVSPILLPNLYGRHRHIWLNTSDSTYNGTEYSLSSTLRYIVHENIFNPILLWDGIPTLYNTHWGLEHSRPIQPFEHLIGHTNDFLRSSKETLPLPVDTWLSAPSSTFTTSNPSLVPVVYVGLGTLSIIPQTFLDTLIRAFTNTSSGFRFIWSVPRSQQQLLPERIRQFTEEALCACNTDCNSQREPSLSSSLSKSCEDYTSPGTVLLVEWAPQVRTLLHPSTRYFMTHGGMNGIAEATYARTPIICIPFFSDQPDNCARAQDFGFGIPLDWNTVTDQDILDALYNMSHSTAYDEAIQRTWIHNTAAGGILRAVQIIEHTANLPYGSYLSAIPRYYYLPWYQAYDIDIWFTIFLFVLALILCVRNCGYYLCCCCVCRKYCSCGTAGKKTKEKQS